MKKIFTLFAALAMVMSMSAAKLYLTPNANWNQSNARFAAYFFGNGEKWISMTNVTGETNLYEVEAPAGYPNVIFCRMNPSASANDWKNKWNQTADLVIPADGKNHYTVKAGTWDKGGGTWSIWPIPAEKNYVDVTITITATASASIKWSNAGDKLANATDYVAMTAGENNTYTYTLSQVDDITGVTYTIKVGDVISEEKTTSTNVTADFKDLMKQAILRGSMNGWGEKDKMTIADDYLTASIVLPLDKGSYSWKMFVGVDWLGGGKAVTRENNTYALGEGDDCTLNADVTGDYTFTWTYATKTLVVTYPESGEIPEPEPTVISYVLMGVQGDWSTGIALTKNETAEHEEYMLLGQEIAEGDAVKVVTLTNGVATAHCGNVDEYSVAHDFDENGNIVLAPGKYDFYFKLNDLATADDDIIYIGAANPVEPEYDPIELAVTDLEIKMDEQVILKGTAMMQSPKDITISLVVDASEENEDGTFNLTDESEITFMGTPMTFISGVAMIDLESNMARAIVRVEFEEMYFEFTFNMTAPIPATVVVVENAIISNNAGFFFMNGTWNDEEETTYPVQVEIQGFDETKAEAEYMATVTVGDIVDENGPWLGSAEGEIVATIVDGVVTITGVLENPYTQVVLDVTISGKLPVGPTVGLENLDTTVAPAKAIVNGQLVIIKNGVQYNATGAVVK